MSLDDQLAELLATLGVELEDSTPASPLHLPPHLPPGCLPISEPGRLDFILAARVVGRDRKAVLKRRKVFLWTLLRKYHSSRHLVSTTVSFIG